MSQDNKSQDWEKEFDEYKLMEYGKWKIDRQEAKHFFRQTLEKERKEIKKMLEDMKMKTGFMPLGYSEDPYNKAIEDIISKIEKI